MEILRELKLKLDELVKHKSQILSFSISHLKKLKEELRSISKLTQRLNNELAVDGHVSQSRPEELKKLYDIVQVFFMKLFRSCYWSPHKSSFIPRTSNLLNILPS